MRAQFCSSNLEISLYIFCRYMEGLSLAAVGTSRLHEWRGSAYLLLTAVGFILYNVLLQALQEKRKGFNEKGSILNTLFL